MLSYALFCLLSLHAAWSAPAFSHVDPASHILIVTPQAQVHLEPALRYVHGLSPLARIGLPQHEETIVYVPAGSAAASVLPLDAIGSARANIESIGLRADVPQARQDAPSGDQAIQIAQQIQQQIQSAGETVAPAFSDAASAASAAAASAGSSFFPSFSPPAAANKLDQKLKTERIELIETPANTLPLLSATEARQFYSVAPIYQPHAVELVRAPVYLAPLSPIRARSLQQPELAVELKSDAGVAAGAESGAPILAQASEQKPDALSLKNALKELPLLQQADKAEKSKLENSASASEAEPEQARFLEANALKEEQPIEKPSEIPNKELKKEQYQEIAPSAKISESQPQQQQQQRELRDAAMPVMMMT